MRAARHAIALLVVLAVGFLRLVGRSLVESQASKKSPQFELSPPSSPPTAVDVLQPMISAAYQTRELQHLVERLAAAPCNSATSTLLHNTSVQIDASRHLFVFAHIPKAAGTAVFNALQHVADGSYEARTTPWFPPRTCLRSPLPSVMVSASSGGSPGPITTTVRSRAFGGQHSTACEAIVSTYADSYLHPGCTASDNRVGAHCSHSELRSCVTSRLAVMEWDGTSGSNGTRAEAGDGGGNEADGGMGGGGGFRRRAKFLRDYGPCGRSRNVCVRVASRWFVRSPLFISILRDPVRRTLSEFAWGSSRWCTAEVLPRTEPSDHRHTTCLSPTCIRPLIPLPATLTARFYPFESPPLSQLIGAAASDRTKEWNPWPLSLCRLVQSLNASDSRHPPRTRVLSTLHAWAQAADNPAINRQSTHLAANLRAPVLDGRPHCLFSHSRAADASFTNEPEASSRSDAHVVGMRAARIGGTVRVDLAQQAWCILQREYWLVGACNEDAKNRRTRTHPPHSTLPLPVP